MTTWIWILIACVIAFGTKFVGYLLPERWLENRWVLPLSHGVTVGLLASLVAANTFTDGQEITIDARIVALLAAAVALRFKALYLLVVVIGAVAAGLARLAGL